MRNEIMRGKVLVGWERVDGNGSGREAGADLVP